MPRDPLTLFPADAAAGEAWRLGRAVDGTPRVDPLPVGADPTPEAVAAAVAAAGGGPVTLALPSGWCLSATVDTAGVPRSGLLFRLELALPLASEDVAADFLPHPRKPTALGIAVAVDRVRPWVDALEAAGVVVSAVCPAALLAIDALRPRDGLVAWGHGSAVDLIGIVGGQVDRWFTLPAEADDVRLYLPEGPAETVQGVDLPEGVATALPGTRIPLDWATAATAAVLSGRRPRVDLARGGLASHGRAAAARRWTVRLGTAAAVLVVGLCGGLLWRAQHYQGIADGERAAQARLFRQLFPGRPVPADVRGRLGSEARLNGGGGAFSADEPTGTGPPAVVLLRGLLSNLPPEARFQVAAVRVADGAVHVEGTAASRADADAVAAGLRAGTGLSVDTPQTQQDGPRAVHFSVDGASANAERGGS
jgi:hypothetical protein